MVGVAYQPPSGPAESLNIEYNITLTHILPKSENERKMDRFPYHQISFSKIEVQKTLNNCFWRLSHQNENRRKEKKCNFSLWGHIPVRGCFQYLGQKIRRGKYRGTFPKDTGFLYAKGLVPEVCRVNQEMGEIPNVTLPPTGSASFARGMGCPRSFKNPGRKVPPFKKNPILSCPRRRLPGRGSGYGSGSLCHTVVAARFRRT